MSDTFSYDRIPYPSKFFLQTHPDRLATLGTLFGIRVAPPESCRVLELGCGNGSNLISHASSLPGAKFVGVDLAEGHIKAASRGAAELGLKNIDFRQMDVAEMTESEFGRFDYIIAHGLFSWVPDFVRDRVLSICREMLTDNGVGYISYNAYPGAGYRRMVQEMLRRHTAGIDEPFEKVGRAISFLAFAAENASDTEIYRAILQKELTRHFEHDTADIFHDDLSALNRAYYITDFNAMLGANGLRFLAEAELHAMGTGGLSQDAKEFVNGFEDIIEREQYLDYLRGRAFRQTLFCRDALTLNRDPEPSILRRFRIASSATPVSPNPEIGSPKPEKFVGHRGITIETDHPLTKAALTELGRSWGRAVPFDELIRVALADLEKRGRPSPDPEADRAKTESILFEICRNSALVELHVFQPEASQELSDRPALNRIARWQLPQANNVLSLLNLDVKIEDEVSRKLLELSDGTRDKAQILADLQRFIAESDEIDRGTLPDDLAVWIESGLRQLARLGMFEK